MKAWQFDYEGEWSEIIYAETRGKAKVKALNEAIDCGCEMSYKDIRLTRIKWADGYGDMDNIPAEILLQHGWEVME